jgi:GNAT superfamily N-acetyltransferase
MDDVFVRRMSRWQAEDHRNTIADIFVEAYGVVPGGEFRGREDFLERFAGDYQRPGFEMVVADLRTTPVACAYGYPLDREGEWWAGFRGELPRQIQELIASGQAFVVAEVMVLPEHRHRGIATRLVRELLTNRDETLLVAPADPALDPAAPATLRSHGWSPLGELHPSRGGGPVQVLTRMREPHGTP